MKRKRKVLIMPQCGEEIKDRFMKRFGEQCEFIFQEKEEDHNITTAEIVIGEPEEEEIRNAHDLQWIQLTWAGADRYTKMKAFPENVILTNASGAFGKIIAEYVIGSMIALYRDLPAHWNQTKQSIWGESDASCTIYGKKVLILGTGDIGRNIAHRMKAFETDVIGIKRNAGSVCAEVQKEFDEIYDLSALDEQITRADIVIGCLPGTTETKGILDRHRLRSMKKNAVIVNVGRGNLIPADDLIRVMQEGHLKGAVLDVFEEEPLSVKSPLWEMENVLITPHIAGPSFSGNTDVQDMIWNICIDNLERYLCGEKLKNIVEIEKGY